jgi:hypothetical protein
MVVSFYIVVRLYSVTHYTRNVSVFNFQNQGLFMIGFVMMDYEYEKLHKRLPEI